MILLNFLAGLDLDIDFGDSDDGGSIIKGTLTFFSVGAYIWRSLLMADTNPLVSLAAGVIAGTIAVIILISFLKWIMRQTENVNWSIDDALFEKGKVYLKIPVEGSGIVQVTINGVNRELKAKSNDENEIPTGSTIMVEAIENQFAIVTTKF